MQRGTDDHSYATAVETYLERVDADVITFEMKDAGGSELEFFRPYKDTMTKKVGIGVVSHRTLQVESPEEVAAFTRRALEVVNAENLLLTSDCGFGRQGSNRMVALYKAAAIAQGANLVRAELGLEERYVPIADASREADGLLDDPSVTPSVYRGLARD
jgi:5-methyltetrahydropteroyltriglutamate--homocysteine methyltransferase